MRRILDHGEYDGKGSLGLSVRTDLQVSHPVLDLGLPMRLVILYPEYLRNLTAGCIFQ